MTRKEYLDMQIHYGTVYESRPRTCRDCKGKNPPYMVNFKLWKETLPKYLQNSLVCISCFEIRLGRNLELDDFIKDCPINEGCFGFDAQVYTSLK